MSASAPSERPSSAPSFRASFLAPKYWPTWIGLGLFYGLSWMPAKLLNWLAKTLAATLLMRNRKRLHIARMNLSLCFPDKSSNEITRMVQGLFTAQARAIIEYPFLWWRSRRSLEKRFDVIGLEQLEDTDDRGQNAIILLCHSASIDVAVSALSMRLTAAGPYKPARNQVVDWMIAKGRRRFGTITYAREDGLRPLIKSIRSGRVLIYAADEDLGVISKCVFAPFFSVPKATVPVLGRMAKSTHATVFTCISYYDFDRSRYVVRVLAPIQGLTGSDDEADAHAMNASIEEAVRHCPDQYLWTLRLFQTRPDGEPSVY